MKSAIKTLQTNHLDYFQSELKKSNKLEIISPFITEDITHFILNYLSGKNIKVITRYDLRDFYSGVSNLEAIKLFYKSGTKISGVCRLHSKLYIFDSRSAIITSSNFTRGGMLSNMEFGLLINDTKIIKDCKKYFNKLWRKADNELTFKRIKEWESKLKKAKTKKVKVNDNSGLGDEGQDCFDKNESKNELKSIRKATGYKKPQASIKSSERYFIKYIGATEGRRELFTKIKNEIEESECNERIYYSYHPRQISDGDIIYFGRMTMNPNDYAIMGRGVGLRHSRKNDKVAGIETKSKRWKKKYKYFNRIQAAEFINGNLRDCILLTRDIIPKFEHRTLVSTLKRWEKGERKIVVSRSLMQKQFVEITPEVANWLDKQLEKQMQLKGKILK